MDASSNAGRGSTPIEAGYERLSERTEAAITQLTSIQITSGAVILADDQFFHPIHRTVSQDVAQCLLSALDHLRFLVWSLQSRNEPFPYAQASLMRTAITGAATALWMVSGETPLERRRRAMEFMFNDLRSRLSWMNTVASEPMHQQHPPSEWEAFERLRTELQHRLDWIVQQANTLLPPDPPFTRRTYGQQTTSDTDIVRAAGAMTPPFGVGGWDPELVLLNTWQALSGYAHARPWSSSLGSNLVVRDAEPNPTTGAITVAVGGNPDRLLDFAFRALLVAENGIGWLSQLSTQGHP